MKKILIIISSVFFMINLISIPIAKASSNILDEIDIGYTSSFEIDNNVLFNYFSIYGVDGISNSNNYKFENNNAYCNVNYNLSFTTTDVPYIYIILNNENTFDCSEYESSRYDNKNELLSVYVDGEKEVLFYLDEDNWILDYEFNEMNSDYYASGITPIIQPGTNEGKVLYKINLNEIFGDDKLVSGIEFKYYHVLDSSYYSNWNYFRNELLNWDDSEYPHATAKYCEPFGFLFDNFLHDTFDIYFPNVEEYVNNSYGIFSLDDVIFENNNVYLKLFNTFITSSVNKIKIDGTEYYLIYDDSNDRYLIDNFHVSPRSYHINSLELDNDTSINVDRDFIFSHEEYYNECYVVSVWDYFEDLEIHDNKFAMYGKGVGRLKNVISFRVNYEERENYGFLWLKHRWNSISKTYDIPESTEWSSYDLGHGIVRRLKENERKYIDKSKFNLFERFFIKIADIELAGIYLDYEYQFSNGKASNYVRNLDYISVVYKTEENTITYGSFYTGGLHISGDGLHVLNGDGSINENYLVGDNFQITDLDGNVVHPDRQNIIDIRTKSNFFGELEKLTLDIKNDDIFGAVLASFRNLFNSVSKIVTTIVSFILGILLIVFGIKLFKFIKKNLKN